MARTFLFLLLLAATHFPGKVFSQVDTTCVWEFIQDQYCLGDTVLTDSNGMEYHHRYDICHPLLRLNLNGDAYPDYLVELNPGGGPVCCFFHDGRTGNLIPIDPSWNSICSRPGIDPVVEIVQIDCENGTDEVLVRSAGGGTIGRSAGLDIYAYNPKSDSVKLIFETTEAYLRWSDEGDGLDTIMVIKVDFHWDENGCFDHLTQQLGTLQADVDFHFPPRIALKKSKYMEHYRLNPKTGTLEAEPD